MLCSRLKYSMLAFSLLLSCSTPEKKDSKGNEQTTSSQATVPGYLKNYYDNPNQPAVKPKDATSKSSGTGSSEAELFDSWRTNGFKKGQSTLMPQEELRFVREKIPQIKQWLAAMPDSEKLEVKGHADNDGNDSSYANEVVSKGRAYYIRNLLIREGVSKYRLRLAWVADREPLDPKLPAEKANRRVSFKPLNRSFSATKYNMASTPSSRPSQAKNTASVVSKPALIKKNGITYVTSATGFKLKGADQGSTMKKVQYKVNRSDFKEYKTPVFFNKEGSYRLVYRSIDAVGNIEPNNELAVIVDDTPPKVQLTVDGPTEANTKGKFLSGSSSINLSADDDGVGLNQIYYSINDGPFEVYSQPIALTSLPPDFKLRYTADDLLDNLSEPTLYSARIDVVGPRLKVRPSSPLVSAEENVVYARGDTRIRVEPTDDESGPAEVYIRTDNAQDYSIYYEPIRFYRQGMHTLNIIPYDKVGNPGQELTMKVLIDESPPVGYEQITGPYIEAGAYALLSPESEISIFGTDDISGVESIEFSVNDGASQPYLKPIRIASEGHINVTYRVTDKVGISSEERTIRAYVDMTPPEVRVVSEKRVVKIQRDYETQFFTNSDNAFRVAAVDRGVGVAQLLVKLSEEDGYQPYSRPLRFNQSGEYTIFAVAVDRVGNKSEETRYRFFVDSTKPVTDFETVGR